MKKIALLISAQHLIPHGGIGQFSKGFAEMCQRLGYFVDVVLDDYPANNNTLVGHLREMPNVKICYPSTGSWGGTKHQKIHAFAESINYEKVCKFRDALMDAMQTSVYDVFLINTPEALFSTYALGLKDYVQHIFYTHNENLVFKDNSFKGVFNDVYDPMIAAMMFLDGISIGTQTERNKVEINHVNAVHLPMPVPERALLESSVDVNKSGVLFIGRWEDRKNPKEFIRIIKETGLPAKVMTNKNGKLKFEAAFKAEGITDYVIKESIVGQEKVDFIKSSKVFFMPSRSESYGFALMEAIGHCHSVVLSEYDWHSNFDKTKFYSVSKRNAASLIVELHNEQNVCRVNYIKELDDEVAQKWTEHLDKFKRRQSPSSSATIVSKKDLFFSDYIESLGRYAGVEDMISVYGNLHRFNVMQSVEGTFLAVDETSIPKKKTGSLDDFF